MPMPSGVRIGLYFSAIVLVGALTTPQVFAEDADSSRARDESSRHHSSEDATGNAAKPDQSAPRDDKNTTPEGQRLPADNNARVPEGKTPGDIDNPNGVRPRRLDAKRDINVQPESWALKNLRRRMLPPQATSNPVVSNSTGLPIPPSEGVERRDKEHPEGPGMPHGPAFSKAEGHFDRPVPNRSPTVTPIAPNRAAINGTGVVRQGSGPPRIGGPTTATSGINGTTIRHQH
jgi:hypothetical protein